jgi:hypothetical protein
MVPPQAAVQGGLFRHDQAIAAGFGRTEIPRLLSSKVWRLVLRGVYVETAIWDALDAEGEHVMLCRARLLQLKPGWHVARRSSLLVHRVTQLGAAPTVPQLLHHRDRPSDRGGSRHERVATLEERDRVLVGGLPVTSLARSVVDVARGERFASGLVTADAALREGLDPAQLAEVAARCSGWPGGLNAVRVVAFADGRAESPLESLSRAACRDVGVPVPEPQVEIYLGRTLLARVDGFWDAFNLVGEADGRVKYTAVDDFYREKLREQALRDAGFEVVRWDWKQAWLGGPAFRDKIRRGMAQGSLNQRDPRVRIVRTTVAEALERRHRALG